MCGGGARTQSVSAVVVVVQAGASPAAICLAHLVAGLGRLQKEAGTPEKLPEGPLPWGTVPRAVPELGL